MENKKNSIIFIVLYSLCTSFFSMVIGDGGMWQNFILGFIAIAIPLYANYILKNYLFSRIKMKYINIYILLLNIAVLSIMDAKDFYVIMYIEIFWFFMSIISYLVRKNIIKNAKIGLNIEIIEWMNLFLILIMIDRLLSIQMIFNKAYIDIFQLLIAILVWKIFRIMIELYKILRLNKNIKL